MANLHAAIGVSQIKINEIQEPASEPVSVIARAAALDWIDAPVVEFDAVNHFSVRRVLNGRDKLREHMKNQGEERVTGRLVTALVS